MVERLSKHAAAGRLTIPELEERTERAHAAVHAGRVRALKRTCPPRRPHQTRPTGSAAGRAARRHRADPRAHRPPDRPAVHPRGVPVASDGLRAAAAGVDLALLAALDQAPQAVERVPDVDEAGVERRDAEPDRVRAAEVGDDVRALDQRAADRPGLVVADRDVRAAARRVARRAER